MTLKNILLSWNGTEAAEAALHVAARLARRHEAHLTGLLAHGPNPLLAGHSGILPAAVAEAVAEADLARRREILDRFRALTADLPPERVHFREMSNGADEGLMAASHAYDLIVLGTGNRGSDVPHMEPRPEVVARDSGRPVLIVPKGYSGNGPNGKALLAWDGGRAAARALSDALSLLTTAREITVLGVAEPEAKERLADVSEHLARHGLAVHQEVWPRHGLAVADVILAACAASGAGLLVMGAYEHSKLAEDLFGGVTRTILRAAAVPVLMSH